MLTCGSSTTVFGLDETSLFSEDGLSIIDNPKRSNLSQAKTTLQYAPRPIPACLQQIRSSVEAATNQSFNFCLVNYYASGADSIAYHSDDEYSSRFGSHYRLVISWCEARFLAQAQGRWNDGDAGQAPIGQW